MNDKLLRLLEQRVANDYEGTIQEFLRREEEFFRVTLTGLCVRLMPHIYAHSLQCAVMSENHSVEELERLSVDYCSSPSKTLNFLKRQKLCISEELGPVGLALMPDLYGGMLQYCVLHGGKRVDG